MAVLPLHRQGCTGIRIVLSFFSPYQLIPIDCFGDSSTYGFYALEVSIFAQGFGVATSAINYAPCLVSYHWSLQSQPVT